MSSIRRLELLARAYVEQALTQLLLDFISREVHVLIVLHKLIERFFLWDDGFGRLGGRARA